MRSGPPASVNNMAEFKNRVRGPEMTDQRSIKAGLNWNPPFKALSQRYTALRGESPRTPPTRPIGRIPLGEVTPSRALADPLAAWLQSWDFSGNTANALVARARIVGRSVADAGTRRALIQGGLQKAWENRGRRSER